MRFEKISLSQWEADLKRLGYIMTEEEAFDLWSKIELPKRSTATSAGYDFYFHLPVQSFFPNIPFTVCTGIRWVTEANDPPAVLLMMPRSSMGFKYGMRLDNTIGVIDADYCSAANEGHIMAKITCDRFCTINPGERFMQGVILPFYTCGDVVDEQRTGGIGSTGQ